MIDLSTPIRSAPVARIGIAGLPHLTDKMIVGGLYVLVAETPPARFPVLAASIQAALQALTPCTVIVPADPGTFTQRIASFGHSISPELMRSKQIALFSMQDEFSKKIFQFGVEGFVQELEQFEIQENSYLVFDQADDLLSLHDVGLAGEQINALYKWSQARKVTVLLVFSRCTEAHVGTLNALMDSMTGLVRLGADKDGLALTFDYWQSDDGTVAARSFRLTSQASGLYSATANAPVDSRPMQDSPTEAFPADPGARHYFFMDPDLGSLARQMAGDWRRVDTLVGMLHATRNTRTATCILSYERDTSLRQLAETVHTLRVSLGRHAKIVVQEKDASLRYQNEALLLRLGVNLVVNRNVPASRLPLLLDSLSSQVFAGDVDINFEVALASVLPARARGYLALKMFAREASAMLGQGETLNIPSALIIGKPVADLSVEDIVTTSGISRPGDLMTGDTEFCYLFLYACPEAVMLSTLDRIFGKPADTVFTDLRFLVQRNAIAAELQTLSLRADKDEVPDYSHKVAAAPASQAPSMSMPDTTARQPQPEAATLPGTVATSARPYAPVPENATPFQPPPGVKAKVAPEKANAPNDQGLFDYGLLPKTPIFGRNVAPRATRSQVATKNLTPSVSH
jgi:cellulose biosynthesis protein BcsE